MADPGTPAELAAQRAALDFASLRAEGIRLLQRLAGGTWTDHNTHDPGITILEQLCYALTDLGYRAQYELPDLLTRDGEDPYASLYTPAQILPTSPVTITDLRKLVIDVPGVKNAWIDIVDEPVALYDAVSAEVSYSAAKDPGQGAAAPASPNVSEIRVKGLYRVRIEQSDSAGIDAGRILPEAARRLHRFRGLGQDFHSIEILGHEEVRLGVTLEIDALGDAATLLASIYQSIAAYISPTVPFHSLTEMLERGWRVDEIFEGPLLEHGFIDSRELGQIGRRSTLRISDLVRVLMEVPGVVAVKDVHFLNSGGRALKEWVLNIPPERTPWFVKNPGWIRLEKRGLQVAEGTQAAAQDLSSANDAARPPPSAPEERDLRPRPGRDRNVASYYPVQQQFPMTYGIGAAGLSRSVPPARKAQAKQLKAYLMFYDQLLANHFAQLANAGKLFSFHDETQDSYFCQAVQDDGVPGLDAEGLRRITEPPEPDDSANEEAARRRNRFLDHLLARFGEHFRELALLQPPASAHGETTPRKPLAHHKRAFLRDYPRIGCDRGVAFNYLQPPSETNVSGLELRLRRKLGASDAGERFHVVEHVLLRPLPGDAHQSGPLFRGAQARDPYSLQITFVFPNWGRYEPPNFKELVKQTVREETPAHLTAYIVWKGKEAMAEFEDAHESWLERLRSYRLAKPGS
jgi:hypothetical protein